ncbi:MAG: RHE_PE00001 family protein [Cohaesibacter sp.]|jgi:hypothetical protein|nr:RHE_PE00001 family protein [Cohaesibacter sp.]
MAYDFSKLISSLSYDQLLVPMDEATRALVRLDERLHNSPSLAQGFAERSHFLEAHASLWLEGEMVHLEDLVLHDAKADIRTPTPELSRAAECLIQRRRIARHKAGWSLDQTVIESLCGTGIQQKSERGGEDAIANAAIYPETDRQEAKDWQALFADLDAISHRADRLLEKSAKQAKGHFAPDDAAQDKSVDQLIIGDHEDKLSYWLDCTKQASIYPPVLAAAMMLDAWFMLRPSERQPQLGRLLVADFLRQRATPDHLPLVAFGLYRSSFRWRARDAAQTRIAMILAGLARGANEGMTQISQLSLAHERMQALCSGRRKQSRLPLFADLFIAYPYVTIPLARKKLGVTAAAIDRMIEQLGPAMPRELTGRSRYRAWGIF